MFSMKQYTCSFTLILLVILCAGDDIREPPSVKEPPTNKIPDDYIRRGGMVQLPCDATGKPEPMYIWMHNGKVLDLNKTKYRWLEKGTIEISNFGKNAGDEGEYQCVASNKYGKSLSQVFKVKEATNNATGHMGEVFTYSGYVGKTLMINNTEFLMVFEPRYKWKTYTALYHPWSMVLVRGKGILQDVEGNLYFTSLRAEDEGPYNIMVLNYARDVILGCRTIRIDVNSSVTPTKQTPSRLYPRVSTLKVDVLEGAEMKIQCIFSGYPDVDVIWSGPSVGLATLEEAGTRLVLDKMTKEAAGEYKCKGTNTVGADTSTITVEMHTIPKFTSDGRPSKLTKTEGETATFTCQTTEDTNPQATVEWMINGDLVQGSFPGPRTEITTIQNGKMLKIIKLNRDEDIMVVQCKVTNKYKTVYINAPLNVLKNTMLTEKPVDQTIRSGTMQVIFVCRATSDPSTPPIVEWLRNGKLLSYYDDTKMMKDMITDTLTLNLDGLDEHQKAAYSGEYMCLATNRYSADSHTAVLKYRDGAPSSAAKAWSANMPWIIPLVVISTAAAAITIFFVIRKRKILFNFTNLRGSEQLELPTPRIRPETDQDGAVQKEEDDHRVDSAFLPFGSRG